MKNYTSYMFLFALILLVGCAKNNQKVTEKNSGDSNQASPGTITGTVEESMNSSDYTFIRMKYEGKDIWVAVSTTPISVGDIVTFNDEMPMENFKSNSLNRTFDIIYFSDGITVGTTIKNMMANPGSLENRQQGVQKPIRNQLAALKPLEDGSTIADIYKNMESLNGKQVRIRGIVVKFNPGIMQTNWIHIQDGTSYNGLYDLTVTCSTMVKIDDQIVVSGLVILDRDFGAGYTYEVMVENADIIVE